MAVRTRSNFKSTKNSRITTNGTGAITGSIMNDMFEDIADSFVMHEDGAGTILKTRVTVSGGATLRGIGTTPVTLIAAPGSGFYLNIVSVALSYNFGTTQYDFGAGEDPCFEFNTTGGRWGFISQATINSGSDFNFTVHHGTNLTSSGGTVIPDNAAFILGTLNDGDATTGDGDLDITIFYSIEAINT